MSSQAVNEFWSRIEANETLRSELDALFTNTAEGVAAPAPAIVDLAARHGFEFTATELQAHLAAADGPQTELNEAELDAVAGGFCYQKITWTSKFKGDSSSSRIVTFD